jgi:uncharacterized coiled-coil protein SlyX
MLEQVRGSFSIDQLERQLAEQQSEIDQLNRAIASLLSAIETKAFGSTCSASG